METISNTKEKKQKKHLKYYLNLIFPYEPNDWCCIGPLHIFNVTKGYKMIEKPILLIQQKKKNFLSPN
jgi:hypothetical protein